MDVVTPGGHVAGVEVISSRSLLMFSPMMFGLVLFVHVVLVCSMVVIVVGEVAIIIISVHGVS